MHKYIVETEIENRFLNDNEKVIFKDGDITNYDVSNLKVMEIGGRSGPKGPVPFQDYHPSFNIYPKNVYKRSYVYLYHKNDREKNTSMYLSRYLVCVDKGEWLPTHLHMHHIDNDIKNDSLDNLEIITIDDHRKITYEEKIEKTPRVEISCDGCNNNFEKRLCEVRRNLNNKKTKSNNFFCSRLCRSKYIQSGNKIKDKELITSNCIICNNNIDIPENSTMVKSKFNPENVPLCSLNCVNKYISKKNT